jgi:hypothetical protein
MQLAIGADPIKLEGDKVDEFGRKDCYSMLLSSQQYVCKAASALYRYRKRVPARDRDFKVEKELLDAVAVCSEGVLCLDIKH